MTRRRRWTDDGTRGTAAVEFALVLPLLLLLVVSTVEVGFLILSHASMNATMARVPDAVRRASDADDLGQRLATLAELPLGLGLVRVTFDPVVESCVCRADALVFLEDPEDLPSPCPAFCGGTDAIRFYDVTGRVSVPSLIPDSNLGVRRATARLLVMAP